MKKYFFILWVLLANVWSFADGIDSVKGENSSALQDMGSGVVGNYVLIGEITGENLSKNEQASVKVFLGENLLEEFFIFENAKIPVLKTVDLSPEIISNNQIKVEIDAPKTTKINAENIKIISIEDANLSGDELKALGLGGKNKNSSYAFINGQNIFDANSLNNSNSSKNSKYGSDIMLGKGIGSRYIYVNSIYGDDTFIGSIEAPKQTLGSAVVESASEDIIILEANSEPYLMPQIMNASGKTITIKATGNVVIRPIN